MRGEIAPLASQPGLSGQPGSIGQALKGSRLAEPGRGDYQKERSSTLGLEVG